MRRLIKDEHGLTLMEIIIVIAIMGIITSMAARFLFSGIAQHSEARDQVDSQANLRLVAFRITDKIRNARHLELLADMSVATEVGNEQIYLDGNQVVYSDDAGNDINMAEDLVSTMAFTVATENGKYVLNITLTSTEGKSITTKVLLNNIDSVSNASGSVLEYDFLGP